jgi:hypothetical protein
MTIGDVFYPSLPKPVTETGDDSTTVLAKQVDEDNETKAISGSMVMMNSLEMGMTQSRRARKSWDRRTSKSSSINDNAK